MAIILDSGNILTKVGRYQLQRPQGTVRIEVHEIILGSENKFVAVPIEPLGMATSRQDLHIQADSEFEAIEKLVEKIQGLSKDEIFPKATKS